MSTADANDDSQMKMPALPNQQQEEEDQETTQDDHKETAAAAATNNLHSATSAAASAASIPIQPQHQFQSNLDLNSLQEADMTNPQKQNLIYTVRNMLLQQADLCHRQADTLEQYSQNISQNRNFHQGNYNEISHKQLEEQITRKLEREAVLKLAKKSFEGMKELQKTMKVFIEYQQRHTRNKAADSSSRNNGRIQQDSDSDSDDDSQADYGTNNLFSDEQEENELILATRNQRSRTKSADEEFNTHEEEGSNYLQEFANSQLSQQSSTKATTPMKRERDEESSSSEEEENDTFKQNEKEQSLTFEDSDDDDDEEDGPGYLDQFAQNTQNGSKPPIQRERDDDSSSDDDSTARKRIKMEQRI